MLNRNSSKGTFQGGNKSVKRLSSLDRRSGNSALRPLPIDHSKVMEKLRSITGVSEDNI